MHKNMEIKNLNESFLAKVEKDKAEGKKIHPLVNRFYDVLKKKKESPNE